MTAKSTNNLCIDSEWTTSTAIDGKRFVGPTFTIGAAGFVGSGYGRSRRRAVHNSRVQQTEHKWENPKYRIDQTRLFLRSKKLGSRHRGAHEFPTLSWYRGCARDSSVCHRCHHDERTSRPHCGRTPCG